MLTYPSPDEFFLSNGGRALLDAHGNKDGDTIRSFFSRTYQAAPKPGEDLQLGKLSPVVPMGGFATLLVWNGGLHLWANTVPPSKVHGVAIDRFIGDGELGAVAVRALDLPRPTLLLTVGQSYGPHIERAQLTIDPDHIIVSGKIEAVLDRDRVDRIQKACAHYNCTPAALRKLVIRYETTLRDPRASLNAPIPHKEAAAFFKVIGLTADEQAVLRLWRNVDQMPLSSDPAWRAVPHMQPAAMAA